MRFVVVISAVLVLAGCATTAPIPATSKTPSPSHPAGWAFCDSFVPGMSDYAGYILETSQGKFSLDDHRTEGAYVAALRRHAPPGQATLIEDYASPWDATDAVVKDGGGSLSLNTDRYKASIVPLMSFCNGVGYKISP